MIVGKGALGGEIIVARLENGEDLLECLQKLCADHGIRNGVILSGYGTLGYASFFGLQSTEYPPPDFYRWRREEGYELLNFTGVIADYQVHAHLTISTEKGAVGGHMEKGCKVLTLAEVVIMKLENIKLKRMVDPRIKQNLLQVVDTYEGLERKTDRKLPPYD
jgi:predicted DNA-binding protein with PD1-like motif